VVMFTLAHNDYPRRDGQVELNRVAGNVSAAEGHPSHY